MPIYEYQCEQCGRVEEAIQKFSDKPLTTCNHCKGKLHKLISQSAFHLKGTGWYVTDYAGKKTQSKAESASGAADSNASTTDNSTKSGSKSATNE